MHKRVSIQGFEGSFHQVAARQYYGHNTEVICCSTFKEVIKNTTASKRSDGGIMAIENSIAGSILPNYNLILKANVKIVGEVYLHIKQHLLVNRGVR
ncbi:MAG TPA: prephenate dehydratase domain-containing protein, partial [Ferruginibacter sp.]|nr:prephenate dehydratase domain-containing protein [Ferruginibacter sp.]